MHRRLATWILLAVSALLVGTWGSTLVTQAASSQSGNSAPLLGAAATPTPVAYSSSASGAQAIASNAMSEAAPVANSSASAGPSSSTDGSPPAAVVPTSVEPRPALAAIPAGADAPSAYNRTLRYVGSVFKPRASDVSYAVGSSGGCVYVTGGNANQVWSVPLVLPEGVQVQALRMYYYDTEASYSLYGWFTKYDLYGNLVQEWNVRSLSSGGNSYDDVAISPVETIDYNNYSYVINWRPTYASPNLQLCGFRVFYYQAAYASLPLVVKP